MQRPRLRRPTRQGLAFRDWRRSRGWSYEDVRRAMRAKGLWPASVGSLRNLETGATEEPYVKVQHSVAGVMGRDVVEMWPDA